MNIGIDFDGVILDTERHNSFWADYYSHFVLNKKRLRNNTVSQELCFDWSKDNFDEFYKTYFMKASKDADFLPGVKEILQKLKDDGHKLYIISLRGFYHKFEVKPALDKIKKLKIDFDGVFFGI